MKITQVCGNALYSIRFVEFFKNDGNVLDAYFELINRPFKCVGIFATADAAKLEMRRLSALHEQMAIKAMPMRERKLQQN
ncbi:MAG: hypothetical protein B0W54_03575 [Cellvibrio sp. 79]|nr:MAG: hypothetical protein B0W54_03575 [Cellvibrio sp. 79]